MIECRDGGDFSPTFILHDTTLGRQEHPEALADFLSAPSCLDFFHQSIWHFLCKSSSGSSKTPCKSTRPNCWISALHAGAAQDDPEVINRRATYEVVKNFIRQLLAVWPHCKTDVKWRQLPPHATRPYCSLTQHATITIENHGPWRKQKVQFTLGPGNSTELKLSS